MSRARSRRLEGPFHRLGRDDEAGTPVRRTPRTPIQDRPTAYDGESPAAVHNVLQDRLLAAAEVALIMGRTLRTLSNWERDGILRPVRIHGRRMYRCSDVLDLMNDKP